ncbi:MAG: cytochrome d ubiquinol oxidase subunit II [Anaerolineaceae bacterium]|nr:cytochrome d ubiquinol oxidase subunit II [Anaerolineaceae bacterium]
MELNTLWFILITILYVGYFVLEGFDFGVGILLPFLGKDDLKRRMIINTIGPHWDGNEVWLITAGGATFAAFPHWYATLFSSFYLPLFLILIALIFRGVAFEFRSKDPDPRWRAFWDWAIFGGSLLPAILWGVTFANFVRGIPIDAGMNYVGNFWDLINGYTLLGGLVTVLLFSMHGAAFLTLKTSGELIESAQMITGKLWLPVFVGLAGFVISSYSATDLMSRSSLNLILAVLALIALLAVAWFLKLRRFGIVFILTTAVTILLVLFFFVGLFPRVLISSITYQWNMTIINTASSPYALRVLSIIALIFLPLVLLYQGWSYWIFRKRITADPAKLEY